ncbi:MAG: YqaJ viral recombinase family protein [Alphaproteobacteria bacterium]|nr:YqaJ viral recombinase family protein [Alphaproteobacteria bacterium]
MIEQGTDQWRLQRCGKLTGSRFVDVLSFLKSGKSSEARNKYMREVVFELMSGIPRHETSGASLAWGKEIEGYAREAYEMQTGNMVTPSEFVTSYDLNFVGSSPDGLIDYDGMIEIKCPHDEGKHIQTLLEGMPEEHIPQIQGNLFVTGRQWCDFISFDPRQSEKYRIYIQRINRDEEFIEKLRVELVKFWEETKILLNQINERVGG